MDTKGRLGKRLYLFAILAKKFMAKMPRFNGGLFNKRNKPLFSCMISRYSFGVKFKIHILILAACFCSANLSAQGVRTNAPEAPTSFTDQIDLENSSDLSSTLSSDSGYMPKNSG